MKVAFVHHWLTNLAGSERVLLEMHKLFPEAPIYTSVYDPSQFPMLKNVDVRTTSLQRLPFKNRHQFFSVLRPRAFRRLDLSEFDLVISSDSAEAKQVKVRPDALHVCYCHTPIRYYWSHYERFISDPGFGAMDPIIRLGLKAFVKPLRNSDYRAAQKVDHFITNAKEVEGRISKYYHRDAKVIYPPVEIERFTPKKTPSRSGFVYFGRLVPMKRVDIAVKACSDLGLDLKVIGRGTELQRLKDMAGQSVEFISDASDQEVAEAVQAAEAFIFPAEEDFGIVAVEAMAAGTPVIAYGAGGVLESVVQDKTGLFFKEQTVESLSNVLKSFDASKFESGEIIKHAAKFSTERFRTELKDFLNSLTTS